MKSKKDSQEIISEKLSQNDADVVTKRQASEIEKRAALALLKVHIQELQRLTKEHYVDYSYRNIAHTCKQYVESCEYAISIGAIETLNRSNTKTQGE